MTSVYLLTNHGVGSALFFLQRLQRRKSIRHVLWLVILYACGLISGFSFITFSCAKLGQGYAVSVDATLVCFGKAHAPYAAAGVLSLLIFVLPILVILIWRPTHRWPSLTGIIDEACCLYEPSLWWWPFFNVLRRVTFGLLIVVVLDCEVKRLTMAVLCILMLAIHGYVR